MKFIKVLRHDIVQGIIKKPLLFLGPLLLAGFFFIDAENQLRLYNRFCEEPLNASWADYWLFAYGGMKAYVVTANEPFQFPISWVMIFISNALFLLHYPTRELQSVAQQTIVHSQNRCRWWLAKCGWNTLGTLLYHSFIASALGVLCLLQGKMLTLEIHPKLLEQWFAMETDLELLDHQQLLLSILLLSILFSQFLNLLQMSLTLFMKPMMAFLFVAMLLLTSAYFKHPIFVGNFAMPVRSSWWLQGGFSYRAGLLYLPIFYFVIILGSCFRFRNYDILNRE